MELSDRVDTLFPEYSKPENGHLDGVQLLHQGKFSQTNHSGHSNSWSTSPEVLQRERSELSVLLFTVIFPSFRAAPGYQPGQLINQINNEEDDK